MLGCIKHTVYGDLGVKSASAPHTAVLDDCLKSGNRPSVLVNRNNVVMRHHNGGGATVLTLPIEEQSSVSHLVEFAGLKYVRIK